MQPDSGQPLEDLRARLAAIESALDEHTYHPGPWQALVRDIRSSTFQVRAALADEVTCVSRKLHLRRPRRRLSIKTGIILEIAATMAGALLLAVGAAVSSNAMAVLGAVIWIVTFQPLIKFFVGRLAGVHYDYVYLLAVEPRLKMKYGTYLARPRLARIIIHLSGTVGSVLAAYLAYMLLRGVLPAAATFCIVAFWLLLLVNVVNFIAALAGMHRLGPLPLSLSSAGSAAIEIREGLAL